MHVYKVIIVGAGVAGLAAAKFLTENGVHDFIVLEAQDRIGGRIDTRGFGGRECSIVELGAQWIHGEDNDFFRFIKSNGFVHQKTSWEGEGQFLTPNGEVIPSEKVQKIIDWVNEQLDSLEDDPHHSHVPNGLNENALKEKVESVGAYLKRNFQHYMEENDDLPQELQMAVFQWANSYHRIDNCCNQMTDLSKLRWADFEINGGELYNNFKTGAQNAISKLSEKFLSTANLRVGHEVTKINWQTEEVQVFVKCKTSQEFYLGHSVFITCSIGVLQHSMNMFSPPLPEKTAEAIKLTGFGPLTKIFLEWETPWWPTEGFRGYQLLWPNEFINCCDDTYESAPDEMKTKVAQNWVKSITGFDPVLDNPNVLLGWLGGPEAVYVETVDDKIVGDKCVEILRQFTGEKVPPPKSVLVSKWSSNPYVRGAYCYRSLGGDKLGEEIIGALQKPVNNLDDVGLLKPALIFAGEALSKTQYSTLHGAFDSGEKQAKKLLELLWIWEKQRSDCESLCETD